MEYNLNPITGEAEACLPPWHWDQPYISSEVQENHRDVMRPWPKMERKERKGGKKGERDGGRKDRREERIERKFQTLIWFCCCRRFHGLHCFCLRNSIIMIKSCSVVFTECQFSELVKNQSSQILIVALNQSIASEFIMRHILVIKEHINGKHVEKLKLNFKNCSL